MSVFRVRKVAFINFGLLFIFLASWISWYMYPLARSVTKEFSFEYGFAAAECFNRNVPPHGKTFAFHDIRHGRFSNWKLWAVFSNLRLLVLLPLLPTQEIT